MPDPKAQPSTTLQIPPDTQAKFGKFVDLIKGSESMNDEERQYWINILPIMTPEQIKNLAALRQIAAGQFFDHERVRQDRALVEKRGQACVAVPEMLHPNGGIDQDHRRL